jgi:hypothetical protein
VRRAELVHACPTRSRLLSGRLNRLWWGCPVGEGLLLLALGSSYLALACAGRSEPAGAVPEEQLAGGPGGDGADEATCCERELQIMVTGASSEVDESLGRLVGAGIGSVFLTYAYGGGSRVRDCPLQLHVMGNTEDYVGEKPIHSLLSYGSFDYGVRGILTSFMGAVKLSAQLEDTNHGGVLKTGGTEWFPERFDWDHRVVEMTQRDLMPVDDLIHDYERLPEKATLEPEKKAVGAGEKMQLHLTGLVDGKNRSPQPWHRVIVTAEHGKILNGEDDRQGGKLFEVGSGALEIEYQAPEDCALVSERVAVFNVCDLNRRLNSLPDKKKELAHAEFEVVCARGAFTLQWNPNRFFEHDSCDQDTQFRQSPVSIPFRVESGDDDCVFPIVPDGAPSEASYSNVCRSTLPAPFYLKTKEVLGRHTGRITSGGVSEARLDFRASAGSVCSPTKDPLKVLFDHNALEEKVRTTVQGNTKEEEGRSPGWFTMHCSSWPLQNGYSEDVGVYRYGLQLDTEQLEQLDALRARCRSQ